MAPATDPDAGTSRERRIAAMFSDARQRQELVLMAYLTVGYPSLDATPLLVEAAARAGADGIELGIPFSDPLADGPTIQAASQLALKGGVSVKAALKTAEAARRRTSVPILFMTYVNPVLAFGVDAFCDAAASAGIDGLIVPDLPAAESAELREAARNARLDLVFFVAPTSTDENIRAACEAATGFIYCIAVTGVTGARSQLDAAVIPLLHKVRESTSLPVVVGFGISKSEHLAALQGKADGVIVASALLDAIGSAPADPVQAVSKFLRELKRER